jgi:peptide chain release factor subunit 1
MMNRDIIRELAEFQSPDGDAITFYYQPDTPQDRSHRHEAIQIKDMVKEAMHKAERSGKNGSVRGDLEKILQMADRLHGNSGKAKAIFACGSKGFWREEDVPARLNGSRLQMNSRFHVTPLANLQDSLERVCVCLLDRSKARFFELHLDEIREQESWVDELPRRGRSDGFAGFDAGHAERKVDNEAQNHFKRVGDRLLDRYGTGSCERIIIGGRDGTWTAMERHLHPYVAQRVVGHFVMDPATASPEEVRQEAEKILNQVRFEERNKLLSDVLDQARANNNGALGLKRVLRALEQGEIQTLIMGEGFSAQGVECGNCGHLDTRMVKDCAVCGQQTHEVEDISDMLLARAMRSGIEVVRIGMHPELQKAGNIGALLRFRAERSMGERLG